jgi:hypothetical protein
MRTKTSVTTLEVRSSNEGCGAQIILTSFNLEKLLSAGGIATSGTEISFRYDKPSGLWSTHYFS